ncbi:hypothetical protein AAVH_18327 [Aphelenchoides avenae]|nr:hypothetical protein AAVH_18327 [Aphelenchus avenae]
MLLANELALEALLFADFTTLVSAKFVNAKFMGIARANDHLLAVQRRFNVLVMNAYITFDDGTNGGRWKSIRYEPARLQSFAVACRELADVIGQHAVRKLSFLDLTWTTPGVNIVFEAVPALKFAQDVIIYMQMCSQAGGNPEAFMRNFVRPKSLNLNLDNGSFPPLSWAFLETDEARELRLVKLFGPSSPTEDVKRSVEDLVRKCAKLPRLIGGDALEIDFTQSSYFPGSFIRRVIELLKSSGREVIFRMRTPPQGDDLVLDEREYSADVDGATTRYASQESAIVVEVEERSITIRRTAEITPAKRSHRDE